MAPQTTPHQNYPSQKKDLIKGLLTIGFMVSLNKALLDPY